ncbi:uncharacterized protein [Montipora capricornis]|uniref:uncharacterized protein n=1 Tax=Montipora capricornis TaxID=246305 RepID=UPI0035F1C98D
MQYITVDQIIRMISSYGLGALIAKFDVEAAYRNIAVHPSDRYLLGMRWRKHYYVDLALPFGLRSAPYIFNSVADMVEWILLHTHNVSALLHYLDDFITAGPPDTNQCAENLATSIAVCRSLGLPLHPDKCIGPSTRLVVLGIELDSVAQVACLPSDKLLALQVLLQSWRNRRWCTRRELESLIGHLHHAAKVVWPGRTFLRRMINLLQCFRKRDHPIRLNSEFHVDLQWWLQFLSSWHGVYFWLFPGMSATPDLEVTSDASGSLGFGAYFNGEWFSGAWVSSQASHSIAYKELFPIIIAAHVWGPHFARRHVSTPGSVASSVHSTSSPGRIDWLSLERQCQFLLAHGLADSTRRSYASGQRKFVNFCAHLGKLHPSGSPCPTDEWTLCLFATFLAGSVKHSSIKVYLSAVRALHIEEGFPDPLVNCLRLQRVLRGIKRTQGSPEAQRLPITDHILMIIFRSLDLSIFDHCMFWAACNLAYFGFLRSAEFTVPNLASFTPALHLSVGDISVDSDANPSCLRVRIKASKTDPFRKGCFVHIGRGRFPLCALQAVLAYLAVRGNSGGPLFLFQDGRPLTRAVLTARLREILAGAGVSGNFSSHSFRIGAATVAARNGIPDHLIQALGRWCSSAYQSYIRTPSESLASLSSHLASGSVGS